MKLLIALFVPLFCLQLGTLVSSQSLSSAVYQLIDIDQNAHGNATNDILKQYNEVLIEINKELYNNILPKLNQTNYDMMGYINKTIDQLTPLEYNLTSCIREVNNTVANISAIASATNVTAKAIKEKELVYEKILHTVYTIGTSNIDTIHTEIEVIYNEYFTCVTSSYPQYCNRTLYAKVLAKQEEIPSIYKKEVEITKINLIQQALIFKNRAQDYVNEIIKTMKPYIALLEICAQQVLSYGK